MGHVQRHFHGRQGAQVPRGYRDPGRGTVARPGQMKDAVRVQTGQDLGIVGVQQYDHGGLPVGSETGQGRHHCGQGTPRERGALRTGVLKPVDHHQTQPLDTGRLFGDRLHGRLGPGERQGRRTQPTVRVEDRLALPGRESAAWRIGHRAPELRPRSGDGPRPATAPRRGHRAPGSAAQSGTLPHARPARAAGSRPRSAARPPA